MLVAGLLILPGSMTGAQIDYAIMAVVIAMTRALRSRK